MEDDTRDAAESSRLERADRARLEAFNKQSRARSPREADARLFDDGAEPALADVESDTLAVEVEPRERPLDLQTWHTLQRIVEDPPARPALPIALESAEAADAEPSVTVGDVVSVSDWAEIAALYAAELRRTPFA